MERRTFLRAGAFGSLLLWAGCSDRIRDMLLTKADDLRGAIKNGLPPLGADVLLTGAHDSDISSATKSEVQDKLRSIAQGSGEEFVIGAQKTDQTWETISFSVAQGDTGGVGYSHPKIQIGGRDAMHVSLDFAGGILDIGKTVALQFRNEAGVLLGKNGIAAEDSDQAMSWSIFTGAHAASRGDLDPAGKIVAIVQEDDGDGFSSNLTQIFGIAIGAFVAFSVLKWIIGIVAFLAMQFMLFLAAAAAIGAIVFLLDNLFGIDLTTSEGQSAFVDFLRQLFDRLLEAAQIVFDTAKEFLDEVDFEQWPPQIPKGAFNLL